jgi:hypothetical protein
MTIVAALVGVGIGAVAVFGWFAYLAWDSWTKR